MSGRWEELKPFGPALDEKALDLFVSELTRWNKTIRLIGPRDEAGAAGQVIDSLLPFLYVKPEFPLLDIGSGAGLPAIPLATLWPAGQIVCVEPRMKRISFINHASRLLGLSNVTAISERAENVLAMRPAFKASFQTVTARALSDVGTILDLARPFLDPGGRVILGRGNEEVAAPGGWRLIDRFDYVVEGRRIGRSVVVFGLDS